MIAYICWWFVALFAICLVEIHSKSTGSAARDFAKKQTKIQHIGQIHNNLGSNSNFSARNGSSDPEVNKRVAQMARYIVHKSNWAPVATIARKEDDTPGYPFNNIKSMVDGPVDNSTGIPYFYLSPKDLTALDLEEDSRVAITLTMDQDGYCRARRLDPEDPKCPRVVVIGNMEQLSEDAEDYKFAHSALFKRHSSMNDWPQNYDYFVAKLNVLDVVLYYKTREARCAPIPLYLSVKPKFININEL